MTSRLERLRASSALRWVVLAFLLVGQYTVGSSVGSINVALPAIGDSLGADAAGLQWVIVVYQLSYANMLVMGGRLGDVIGRKRAFLIGIVGFVLASVVAGCAQSVGVLIAGRLAQGVTGGFASPQILAVIQLIFGVDERRKAFALFSTVTGGSFMLGQLSTGGLVSLDLFGMGWRLAFLVNVVPGTIAVIAVAILLPRRSGRAGQRLDSVGSAMLTIVVLLVLFPLIQGRSAGWPPEYLLFLALGAPAVVALVVYERRLAARGGHPILNPRLLRSPSFSAGLTMAIFASGTSFPGYLFLTITLQSGFDLDPWTTAITTTPVPIGLLLATTSSAHLVKRFGRKLVAVSALLHPIALAAVALVLHGGDGSLHQLALVGPMLLLGFSQGIGAPTVVNLALLHVAREDAGSASGLYQTTQQLASGVGIALIGAVYFSALSGDRYVHAFSFACVVLAIASIPMFLFHFRLPRRADIDGPPARPAVTHAAAGSPVPQEAP